MDNVFEYYYIQNIVICLDIKRNKLYKFMIFSDNV